MMYQDHDTMWLKVVMREWLKYLYSNYTCSHDMSDTFGKVHSISCVYVLERERERERELTFVWIIIHAVSENQHFMINSCEQ